MQHAAHENGALDIEQDTPGHAEKESHPVAPTRGRGHRQEEERNILGKMLIIDKRGGATNSGWIMKGGTMRKEGRRVSRV